MQKFQWKSAGKDSINYLKIIKKNQNVLEDEEGEQVLCMKTKANLIFFLHILIFLIGNNILDSFSGICEHLFLERVDVIRLLCWNIIEQQVMCSFRV